MSRLGDPLGDEDFLPSPAELAFNEEAVKVTLALSKKSIDFFKTEAAKSHAVPAHDSPFGGCVCRITQRNMT